MSSLGKFLQVVDTDWQTRAACLDADPALFSPLDSRGRVILRDALAVALRYCAACPVLDQCYTAASHPRLGAQEMVQAGHWWPIATSVEKPLDLLDRGSTGTVDQAAAA